MVCNEREKKKHDDACCATPRTVPSIEGARWLLSSPTRIFQGSNPQAARCYLPLGRTQELAPLSLLIRRNSSEYSSNTLVHQDPDTLVSRVSMTATETQAVGGRGLLQSLRQSIPMFGSKSTTPPHTRRHRLDLHASSGAPVLEKPAQSPWGSPAQPSPQQEAAAAAARRNSEAPQPEEPRDYGFDRGMERRFEVQRELARGGNGVVHLVLDRTTGLTYAMKTIPKTLTDPNLSEK
jgi:hypothetical protein